MEILLLKLSQDFTDLSVSCEFFDIACNNNQYIKLVNCGVWLKTNKETVGMVVTISLTDQDDDKNPRGLIFLTF